MQNQMHVEQLIKILLSDGFYSPHSKSEMRSVMKFGPTEHAFMSTDLRIYVAHDVCATPPTKKQLLSRLY
jgi:hypothetical protein